MSNGTAAPTLEPTLGPTDPPTNGTSMYIGVAISICGNIMISVALNIQKYTHNKNERSNIHVPYMKRPMWWLGLLLMLGGECGNFLAYAFAPASVVAPLGTVALVSNALIAPFALKEKFRVQDLLGILFAIGGAIVVVIFSASEQEVFTYEQLLEAFKKTKFLVYLGLTFVGMCLLLFLSPRYGKKFLAIDMLLVGLFGGYTVIATKAISSLITQGFLVMFTYWLFYVMLVLLLVTGVLQIRYLQAALQTYDSTEVIPTQFVMFTMFAIIGGGVLYDDFAGMPPLNIVLFIVGILLTFIGVFLISKGRKGLKTQKPKYKRISISGPDRDDSALLYEDSEDIYKIPEEPVDPSLGGQVKKTLGSALEAILDGLENRRATLVVGIDQTEWNYRHDDTIEEHIRLKSNSRVDALGYTTVINGGGEHPSYPTDVPPPTFSSVDHPSTMTTSTHTTIPVEDSTGAGDDEDVEQKDGYQSLDA